MNEGGAFNAGPDVGFYSAAASVKARSGLGRWTDGQGEQLLFFHHFKTECLECLGFFLFKKKKQTNRTTICLVTIHMFISDFFFSFFFRKTSAKMNPKLVYLTWFSNQLLHKE